MPQVGKWTTETPDTEEGSEESGCWPCAAKLVLLFVGNVAMWWWAVAQIVTALRG